MTVFAAVTVLIINTTD